MVMSSYARGVLLRPHLRVKMQEAKQREINISSTKCTRCREEHGSKGICSNFVEVETNAYRGRSMQGN